MCVCVRVRVCVCVCQYVGEYYMHTVCVCGRGREGGGNERGGSRDDGHLGMKCGPCDFGRELKYLAV